MGAAVRHTQTRYFEMYLDVVRAGFVNFKVVHMSFGKHGGGYDGIVGVTGVSELKGMRAILVDGGVLSEVLSEESNHFSGTWVKMSDGSFSS